MPNEEGYARVHSTWEFVVLRNKENFSSDEFEKIGEAIAEWSKENLITPYQLLKTDKGFEITIGTFCETGAGGIAQDLFLNLVKGLFRETGKSVAYVKKENSGLSEK